MALPVSFTKLMMFTCIAVMAVFMLTPCFCANSFAQENNQASERCPCSHDSEDPEESCCCGCSSAKDNGESSVKDVSLAGVVQEKEFNFQRLALSPKLKAAFLSWYASLIEQAQQDNTQFSVLHEASPPLHHSNYPEIYLQFAVLRL